jgi:hypothetical protein
MTFIRPAHLRRVRRICEAQLPDRCTIERRQLISDGAGDFTVAYTPIATAVPVLLMQARWKPVEVIRAEKLTGMTQWEGMIPSGQDLKATDRITVTTLGNRVFEVAGIVSASYEPVRQFQATEIL